MDKDIYTEPEAVDPEALRNLGPLTYLAGSWEGLGVDTHPVAEGTKDEPYLERIEFEPIDPQANGPQLLYGLRYHVHINKLDERPTFHDQVGYWLWEPSTGELMQSVAIPRGLVALARGRAESKAKSFMARALLDAPNSGIVSAPFLHENFRTVEYTITVTVHGPDAISYEQDTLLEVAGRPGRFHHLDKNQLHRTGPAKRNPSVLPLG